MATTIYEVKRITYTHQRSRGEIYTAHYDEERALYTSRNKAIDRAKSFAEPIKDYSVQAYWKAFEERRAKSQDDYLVVVDEYTETEGKLSFDNRHYLLETDKGKVYRHDDTPFFNLFL